ncbi:TerB N-terminal domain-containing protein [Pseudonocardia sp. DR1-2]|uniref:TerB N-terminal domain-containing protein n=1 Tax=Pseudonocardia sp. DR1-2 TaxID=2951168 RepID=UPI0027E26EC4|nr:TerB N-terminal domain-containing protein [Pseudonocardia sp. DR1-2]
MTTGSGGGGSSTWCPPGRAVTVGGVAVRDGGFYIGPGPEPSTVDPYLTVDLQFPDWDGHTVGVLSYDRFSPAARGAYLMWLATGRRAAQAPPAWAALYLRGLERRLLVDGDDDPTLLAEARALGAIYGATDPSVAALAAGLAQPPRATAPPPTVPFPAAFPSMLAVEVGRQALAAAPLSAEWALAWAWYSPEVPHGEAARRAPDQFAELWRHHFRARHPRGFVIPTRRRRLVLEYVPANPTLSRPMERMVADASDVVDHPAALAALRAVTAEVERELAPFAHRVARRPDSVTDVAAQAALLPEPLLSGSGAYAAVVPLLDWAAEAVASGGPVVVHASELAQRWSGDLDRAGSLAVAQVLERRGVGVEPDVRFGGSPLGDDGPAVLFHTGPEPVSAPGPAYVLAAVATELCLAVAAADGRIDDAEVEQLTDRVDRIEELSASERARLGAHRVLVGERRVDLEEVTVRAAALDASSRRELAGAVIDVALADGAIGPDELRVVVAVHEVLGVVVDDPRLVAPGATETDLAEPVPAEPVPADPDVAEPDRAGGEPAAAGVVAPGETTDPVPADGREPAGSERPESGRPEPVGPEPGDDGAEDHEAGGPAPVVEVPPHPVVVVPAPRTVSLDEVRLARTQASNADVRALLGAIFADPDEDESDEATEAATGDGAAPAPVDDGRRVGPLDGRHSTLLLDLAEAGEWSRSDWEAACARIGVLPDGALDVVNEAAYDLADDVVIELLDDGSVVVDTDILEEMRA